MRKPRINIDLPADVLEEVEREAARLKISRNEAITRLLRAGLGQKEVYFCPFCHAECRPGVKSCIHFDPEEVTWRGV
ncbi:MAG: CopG family transcriptional regulator [Moorella humiferrea]|nr:CopG family transcriptional regulator [Moorella humiferrea]